MSEHTARDDGTPNGETRRAASRLERRLSYLEGRPQPPEPISVLRLLNTEELRLALALIQRAGVLPSGEVLHPEAFREATPQELEALEHWRQLCGEPLDHLELAEELVDRVGEARGWRSGHRRCPRGLRRTGAGPALVQEGVLRMSPTNFLSWSLLVVAQNHGAVAQAWLSATAFFMWSALAALCFRRAI